MISFERSYKTSDGKFHATLQEAQVTELTRLLQKTGESLGYDQHVAADAFARAVFENREAVLNILTTTDTSRPKARKANGATRKPRTPKAATAELPLKPENV